MTGSPSQVAERWRQWKRSIVPVLHRWQGNYECCPKATSVASFSSYEPVNVETDDAFSVCLRKLDAHFRADDKIPYERLVFRQLAPMQGKAADKFMVCLRKQARHFSFGESLNENLRDQLVAKLADAELKKKLLSSISTIIVRFFTFSHSNS